MEYHRRRGRRGRGHSYATFTNPEHSCGEQETPRQFKFTHSITSFLILSSLIGIIYFLLDNHCYSCGMKYDNRNLTKSIGQIEHDLLAMKNNYNDLEMKLSHFNEKLPKLEGQIDILEALANTMVQRELRWDPKVLSNLPNLDMLLNKILLGNRWNISAQELITESKPKNITTLRPIEANPTKIKFVYKSNEL